MRYMTSNEIRKMWIKYLKNMDTNMLSQLH